MVDYSKWKDIEISDDEDDTHPNIDTPSLFRWRHQARVERMEQAEQEKKQFEMQKQSYGARLADCKKKIAEKDGDLEQLQKQLKELEMEGIEIKKRDDELRLKEKKTPWNVDTISKEGFQKTVINKNINKRKDENLTEEERAEKMKNFVKDNEKLIKQLECLENVDPRGCSASFFVKIQDCVPEYKAEFEKEIRDFIARIKKRAEEKIQEAIAEQEEEDRKERLGPGGLDPAEVFEELPECLKKCFESRDIKLLQETILTLPEKDAKYHMKRCVDSGLWVPDGGVKSEEEETKESEPIYSESPENASK
uniref:Hsp90 chaperone protein kinase-targeting subunit n=1 Tax=Megaselia scalaris TaxID=36166 RepID=T1H0Y8_MEGSC